MCKAACVPWSFLVKTGPNRRGQYWGCRLKPQCLACCQQPPAHNMLGTALLHCAMVVNHNIAAYGASADCLCTYLFSCYALLLLVQPSTNDGNYAEFSDPDVWGETFLVTTIFDKALVALETVLSTVSSACDIGECLLCCCGLPPPLYVPTYDDNHHVALYLDLCTLTVARQLSMQQQEGLLGLLPCRSMLSSLRLHLLPWSVCPAQPGTLVSGLGLVLGLLSSLPNPYVNVSTLVSLSCYCLN